MSIVYTSGRNIQSKKNPPSQTIPVVNTWTRPADWLTLPTVGPTDQKLVGLYAVFDNGANYVAVLCTTSTGTYTVDWGDGSSPVTVSSGSVAQYAYNYASISSGTLTTRGYKQVIITITPTSGNLLTFDLDQKYVNSPVLSRYNTKWLDISMGSPYMTDFNLPKSAVVSANMLEQVTFVSKGSTFVDFTDAFYLLFGLRKVNISADMSTATSTLSMFYNCSALEEVPYFDTTNVVNMQWMFMNCYNLRKVPTYNTSNVTNMTNMFNSCRNLTEIPPLDTSKVSSIGTFATNCVSLKKLPYLNTINVSTATQMFDGCTNITTSPAYNWSNLVTGTQLYANCASLVTIPPIVSPNLTTATSMFNGCTSLNGNITIDTTKVTDASSMFASCRSLSTAPSLNLSNATTTVSMFISCVSLTTSPAYDLSNCTTANTMFSGCTALQSVGNLNTPNLTFIVSTFQNCASLETVPNFDTTKVTNIQAMFAGCQELKSEGLPTYNFSNVTSASTVFQNCNNLVSVPSFNFNKATTVTSMFQNASSLVSIPAFNFSNVTAVATSFANGANSMGVTNLTGIKFSVDYTNCLMNKTNLELMFTNLGTAATTQTVTITSNPGADTAIAKTGTWTTGSKNVTITVAGSVVTGMYMYGAIAGINCSFTDAGDIVTVTGGSALAPIAGTVVAFPSITSTTGISINTLYYVINPSGATFQVALTPGGSAIALTTNGTGTVRYALTVTNVVGTTITLDNYPMTPGTSSPLTFRYLNTNLATFKNWTVSG